MNLRFFEGVRAFQKRQGTMMDKRSKFGVGFDRLLDFFLAVGCVIMVFQVLSVSADVFSRYFFNISFLWVTPINEWGLVYLTFLGAAWLQREKGHVGDDSVDSLLPAPVRRFFRSIGVILAIASCGVLFVYGAYVVWQLYEKNTYDFFKLESIPLYAVYVVIPFGGFLWLLQIVRELVSESQSKH